MLFCTQSTQKFIGASADEHEHRLVQHDLDMIEQWSEDYHLPLSIDNCMCMQYGHHYPKLSYFINGVSIKDTEQCTDLGLLRTSDFRYNLHIDAVCLKNLDYLEWSPNYSPPGTVNFSSGYLRRTSGHCLNMRL